MVFSAENQHSSQSTKMSIYVVRQAGRDPGISIAMPPLFSALTMLSGGKNTQRSDKKTIQRNTGHMKGKNKPEYVTCVDRAAKAAIKGLIRPSLLK